MGALQKHLRNTFLAGIFATIPIAVTAFVIWYADRTTRDLFQVEVPFLGIVLAVVGIYLLGLAVSSLIGRYVLALIDKLLSRIPVLKELYQAWKHVSITPGGKEGIFAKVCLIPDVSGRGRTLGFTSGEPIDGDPSTVCVFVPAAPNPTSGRLCFMPAGDCVILADVTPEEAFKLILSGGNYLPAGIAEVTRAATPCTDPIAPAKAASG